ncbi:MAG: hypothetical protein RSB70_03470 [Clostridium sp.]
MRVVIARPGEEYEVIDVDNNIGAMEELLGGLTIQYIGMHNNIGIIYNYNETVKKSIEISGEFFNGKNKKFSGTIIFASIYNDGYNIESLDQCQIEYVKQVLRKSEEKTKEYYNKELVSNDILHESNEYKNLEKEIRDCDRDIYLYDKIPLDLNGIQHIIFIADINKGYLHVGDKVTVNSQENFMQAVLVGIEKDRKLCDYISEGEDIALVFKGTEEEFQFFNGTGYLGLM